MKNWKERVFDVSLILVGFLLGLLGTFFAQRWEANIKREAAIKIVKVEILRKIESSRNTIEMLGVEKLKHGQLEMIGPRYDPVFFYSAMENIGFFDEKIIVALLSFYQSARTSQEMRDFMIAELARVDKNVLLAGDSIDAYIRQLRRLVRVGEATLIIINEKYPSLKVIAVPNEFQPQIDNFELRPLSNNGSTGGRPK